MRMVIRIALVVIGLAVITAFGLFLYDLRLEADWCDWVHKAQIAGQRGSTEADVRQFLGNPTSVESPEDLGSGFSPVPPVRNDADHVLVYRKLFLAAGGLWAAYFYIDGRGRVLAFHLATS